MLLFCGKFPRGGGGTGCWLTGGVSTNWGWGAGVMDGGAVESSFIKLKYYRTVDEIQKGAKAPSESNLVARVHSNWNNLRAELARWKALSRSGNLFASSTAQY